MDNGTEPTASAVNRAGQIIRRYLRGDARATPEKVESAILTIAAFRAAHQAPLSKANMGLRSMVRSEQCRVEISQRLKRWPTILDKLVAREPTLAMSKMQDIGGCRAVLDSVDEIYRVEARLRKRRPVVDNVDYIQDPRESGYRGVHVVVLYDERQIEIQLRTRVMHEWALTMERLSSRTGLFLKSDGSHPVQEWMAIVAEAMAVEESGRVVSDELASEIQRLRQRAETYL